MKKIFDSLIDLINQQQNKKSVSTLNDEAELEVTTDDICSWEEPGTITDECSNVEEMTPDYLPERISEYVFSEAKRLNNAPVEYVAVAVLVSAAAVLGGSAVIQPKRDDTDWTVVPTLWGALVGGPSLMKSPSAEAGTNHIFSKDKAKDSEETVVINDVTPEAVAITLAENPKGILLYRDELAGWLINLDKEERAAERAFYLQAFNGSGRFVQDRVSRDKIEVDPLIISVLGGIQPSLLLPLLKSRNQGKSNDGLFERMQLMVFPDANPKFVDMARNPLLELDIENTFQLLKMFRVANQKARFQFSDDAYQTWKSFSESIVQRLSNESELTQALLGKYPALCAKLALVFHMLSQNDIENIPVTIDNEHVVRAVKWSKLLESHYKRLMNLVDASKDSSAAETLVSNLAKLPNPFSKRDLVRKKWRNLSSTADCEKALQILLQTGHLKVLKKSVNGRVASSYAIHPDFVG